jgi:hypothetical protein
MEELWKTVTADSLGPWPHKLMARQMRKGTVDFSMLIVAVIDSIVPVVF